jgi:hypothetical protein
MESTIIWCMVFTCFFVFGCAYRLAVGQDRITKQIEILDQKINYLQKKD